MCGSQSLAVDAAASCVTDQTGTNVDQNESPTVFGRVVHDNDCIDANSTKEFTASPPSLVVSTTQVCELPVEQNGRAPLADVPEEYSTTPPSRQVDLLRMKNKELENSLYAIRSDFKTRAFPIERAFEEVSVARLLLMCRIFSDISDLHFIPYSHA
jgi:hypothetical protein